MAQNKDEDYKDILDHNVSEVKKAIRDLENPDYQRLLELEQEGKDRKTIGEFLENKAEQQEEEEEEIVEEIEEETAGGLLAGFSRNHLLAGGVLLGLLIGLITGFGFATQASGVGVADAQDSQEAISSLFEASNFEGEVTFTDVTVKNGMRYVAVNMTSTGNQSSTGQRTFYVSPDAELLFPEIQSAFIQTPINIEETISQLEQQQQPQNTTGQ